MNIPKKILCEQRGQMAIFVALIFQVLFVFFAMAINVALIIHDKINLQNSVDLAAYYAASKQAELLNAMAHQNYQIRQAWKLYAWRYRVLGTTGLLAAKLHPSRLPEDHASITESEYNGASVSNRSEFPVVCVNYQPTWPTAPRDENVCKSTSLNVPEIPEIQNVAAFLPINHVIAAFSRQLRSQFDASCDEQGIWNWWFMKAIKESYRQDQASRRRLIEGLAANLARPSQQIVDIDGHSILDGVRATLFKNLTWSNSQSPPQVLFFNSLSGVPRQQWLKEIYINPTMFYTDFETAGSAGCRAITTRFVDEPRNRGRSAWNFIMQNLEGEKLRMRREREPEGDVPERLSIGYEKNPWVLGYVGVQATVQSRQLFHPFGEPVTLTARAFAKPFGGRIGPWYARMWKPGAPESEGAKVDVRGPPRTQANGLMDSHQDPDRLPNYSRFPGDALGLASRVAQAGLKSLAAGFKGSLFHYYDIYSSHQSGRVNDPLAWDRQTNTSAQPRLYEIAAVAPDLFDITYYSIDANYWGNYGSRIENNRGALGLNDDVVVRADLGSRGDQPALANFSVQNQINLARSNSLYIPKAFYFVRDRQHLLTGWVPGDLVNNYPAATDESTNFGRCVTPDFSDGDRADTRMPTNPGSCIAGGRTGYSIKFVSRNYLLSSEFKLGGPEAGTGPILNPPPF